MKTLKYSEIIQNQATINIGCLGSVSEGKSTTVRMLSKTDPHRHQKERERNSTVNLGYANFKIWRNPKTGELVTTKGELESYRTSDGDLVYDPEHNPQPDSTHDSNSDGQTEWHLIKHLSFVDCPGHENFMTTMMSGTGVMDGVLLLIAANSPEIPLRQTQEHMAVLERTDISKILVLQNKIDLLGSQMDAQENLFHIRKYLEGTTRARGAHVVPVSAQFGTNLDFVLSWLVDQFETWDLESKANKKLMLPVIRSFDVNKPGTRHQSLVGGVIGGSISKGYLEKGDTIEIRPGINKVVKGSRVWSPILAKVESISVGKKQLEYAVSGGLIGVGLSIDPFWTVSNKLVGQVAGHPGQLPSVYSHIKIKIEDYLIKGLHFLQFNKGEIVLVITANNVVRAKWNYKLKADLVELEMAIPVCIPAKSKVAIAKLEGTRSTLAIVGVFKKGIALEDYILPENYNTLVEEFKARDRTVTVINDLESDTTTNLDGVKADRVKADRAKADGVSEYDLNSGLPSYQSMLSAFSFNKTKSAIKVPPPEVLLENKKTAITNVGHLLPKIHQYAYQLTSQCQGHSHEVLSDFEYRELFRKFVAKEMIKQARYTGAGALLIDGIFQPKKVQNIVGQYVQKYVVCKVCGSNETIYYKDYCLCDKCGARNFIERI